MARRLLHVLLIIVTSCFCTGAGLMCIVCGGTESPDGICHGPGELQDCDPRDDVCTLTVLNFSRPVNGISMGEIKECSKLESYAANCRKSSRDFSLRVNLPLQYHKCYFCRHLSCNEDKSSMVEIKTAKPSTPSLFVENYTKRQEEPTTSQSTEEEKITRTEGIPEEDTSVESTTEGLSAKGEEKTSTEKTQEEIARNPKESITNETLQETRGTSTSPDVTQGNTKTTDISESTPETTSTAYNGPTTDRTPSPAKGLICKVCGGKEPRNCSEKIKTKECKMNEVCAHIEITLKEPVYGKKNDTAKVCAQPSDLQEWCVQKPKLLEKIFKEKAKHHKCYYCYSDECNNNTKTMIMLSERDTSPLGRVKEACNGNEGCNATKTTPGDNVTTLSDTGTFRTSMKCLICGGKASKDGLCTGEPEPGTCKGDEVCTLTEVTLKTPKNGRNKTDVRGCVPFHSYIDMCSHHPEKLEEMTNLSISHHTCYYCDEDNGNEGPCHMKKVYGNETEPPLTNTTQTPGNETGTGGSTTTTIPPDISGSNGRRPISCVGCGGKDSYDGVCRGPYVTYCEPDNVCILMEIHFTHSFGGRYDTGVKNCEPLSQFREKCRKPSSEIGLEFNLPNWPVKEHLCFYCPGDEDYVCNDDKHWMIQVDTKTPEETTVSTEAYVGPPSCIHCGWFDVNNLRTMEVCTNYREVRRCANVDDVCGLIYMELRKPPRPEITNATVYQIMQCISLDAYRKKFSFWNKRLYKLKTKVLNAYYCTDDDCNSNRVLMTNILTGSSSHTRISYIPGLVITILLSTSCTLLC